MTVSKSLLKDVQVAAQNLKSAARWNGSGLAVDIKTDDFLYELLCYFHVALAATAQFTLSIVSHATSPSGRKVARWPKKPGNKANFSYIQLISNETGKVSFELCPGIRITDVHGKKRAPDINLLDGEAPDAPTYAHLLACWDAKFTTNESHRLPDTAVSDFTYTVRQMGSPSPPSLWTAHIRQVAYHKSGLFTNGLESTEPDAALTANGVMETCNFPKAPKTRP